MKLSIRYFLVVSLAIASQSVVAAETYLSVFFGDAPLQGLEVVVDGETIGQTDSLGSAASTIDAGTHEVELLRDGESLSTFSFSTSVNEDAEITITFLDQDTKPQIDIKKYAVDDTSVSGTIGGVVKSSYGQPIEGAVIAANGSSVSTDSEGRYQLQLPRGEYDVSIEHPEYVTASIDGLRVMANVARLASANLKPKSSAPSRNIDVQIAPPIEEVIILGTFKSQGSSFELERFSTNVTDAIDISQIERFGDSSAAAALNRIVGVNVSDGKYANVRGLAGRYISSSLNGLLMPSTDPLRRDVQLDLFPSNILQGIEIQKSYSPDMLGTTTGGSVRMNTRGLPDGRVSKISLSTGYNSEFTGDEVISYESSNTDWMGFDSGLRKLPDSVKNQTDGGLSLTICDVNIDPDRCTDPLVAASLAVALEDDYNVDRLKANPDISLSASYGDRFGLDHGDLGFYAALSYKNETDNRVEAVLSNPFETRGAYERSKRSISVSGYFVGGYEFREDDEILSKTILLRSTDDTTRREEGIDDEDNAIQETTLEWVERQFISQQFSGKHDFNFGDEPHVLDWRIGFSQTDRYEPDRRTYLYLNTILSTSAFERRWSELTEDSLDVGVDYTIPITLNDRISTEITLGGLLSERSREVLLYRFGIQSGDNVDEISFAINQNLENVLSYGNFVADRVRLSGNTTATDSYDAEEDVNAYFISTKTEIDDAWTILAGVRQEDFFQLLSYPNEGGRDDPLESDDPLPVAAITYALNDHWQFRAGWSETVSYPGLIERSESQSFDPETNRPIFGNPKLKVSNITNADFRAEYYFTDEESISFAVFNKEIESPVERAVTDGSGSAANGITFRNALSATVNGIELDINKNVIDNASFLAFVSGNLSFIDSEVELDADSIRLEGSDSIGRELQGQAPLLANLQFGLDHIPSEQKMTMLINYTDDYIFSVTRGANNGPEYFDARVLVDLNYEKLFGESLSVKVQLKNVLNEDVSWTQNGRTIETYKEGTSFSVGVSYEL